MTSPASAWHNVYVTFVISSSAASIKIVMKQRLSASELQTIYIQASFFHPVHAFGSPGTSVFSCVPRSISWSSGIYMLHKMIITEQDVGHISLSLEHVKTLSLFLMYSPLMWQNFFLPRLLTSLLARAWFQLYLLQTMHITCVWFVKWHTIIVCLILRLQFGAQSQPWCI